MNIHLFLLLFVFFGLFQSPKGDCILNDVFIWFLTNTFAGGSSLVFNFSPANKIPPLNQHSALIFVLVQ